MSTLDVALTSLERMPQLPSLENFICILQKCRKKKNLAYAKRVHAYVCKRRLEAHIVLGNYLVPMFVECGSMCDAQQAFIRLVVRSEFCWTSLITGYTECGESQHALYLYQKMKEDWVHPSKYTFLALLKACARLNDMARGQEIHAEIARERLESNPFVGSALVDMYAKCGFLAKAQEVFDRLAVRDVISWTALITGYAEHGLGEEALNCFSQMQWEGVSPDAITFVCSLKACGSMRAIDKGREIHAEIARKGLESDPFVGNTLIDMYSKCIWVAKSQEVFDRLAVQDVVSWNALISGYAEHGLVEEVLNGFEHMQVVGVSPDAVTFVCSLKACGSIGALEKGQQIHAEIARKGIETELCVGGALVDLYAKFGLLSKALEVFDRLPVRNVISWTALVAGYAQLGEGEVVFHMFERMRGEGIKPSGVTCLSVLTVCSHAGLVDIGQKYFEAMSKDYGIIPNVDHHICMVDLLGRAGQLDKVVAMVEKMPFHPNLLTWHTVLAACQKWGNVEIGRKAFEQAVRIDGKDAAAYVLMSNIYADAYLQED